MRIRGISPIQPLRSRRVGDVQRVVVTRSDLVVVDRSWRRGSTLSVVMRLHLRKCGKIWRKVNSRRRRGRRGHGRVAGAVVRNRDALVAAACELAAQFVDALEKAHGLLLGVALPKAHTFQFGDALTTTTDDLSDGAGSGL